MSDRIYEFDSETGNLVEAGVSSSLDENVMLLVNIGFKIGNKPRLESLKNKEIPFDRTKPDVAMVATDYDSSPIKHGVAFLYAHPSMKDSEVFVYTALDANTPKSVVEHINNNFGGSFHQLAKGEPYGGYLCLQKEKPAPGESPLFDNPYEAAARAFNDTGVKTVPLRADPSGVGFFPMYLKDGGAFSDMSLRDFNSSPEIQVKMAEELTTYLGPEVFSLDLNEIQEVAALNKQEGFSVSEPELGDRYRPDARMRMGV